MFIIMFYYLILFHNDYLGKFRRLAILLDCVWIYRSIWKKFVTNRNVLKMAEKQDAHQKMERDFSRVILSLENCLIPADKLSPTPSMQDGLDIETEKDLRILGCELIQISGILLRLPQVRIRKTELLEFLSHFIS